MIKLGGGALNAILGVVLLFLLGPFVIILLAGVSAGETLTFPPQGLSLRWFGHVLSNDAMVQAFYLSLGLGVVSTLGALVLGIPAAYGLSRYQLPGAETIRSITVSPAVVPGLVAGLALLRYAVVPLNVPVLWALVLAHTALLIPYAVRVVGASLGNLGTDIEEAAAVLGLGRVATFRQVCCRMCAPASWRRPSSGS